MPEKVLEKEQTKEVESDQRSIVSSNKNIKISGKNKKILIQNNHIDITPLKKFIEKIEKDIEGNEYEYMNQQWITSIEAANKFIVDSFKEK